VHGELTDISLTRVDTIGSVDATRHGIDERVVKTRLKLAVSIVGLEHVVSVANLMREYGMIISDDSISEKEGDT